ncbi:error-prone DNA polymerase [Shewanella algae]|uniref:error-prone DNA polymerase n=1 Tax=Shewanella algae TaxID=38313 RepID=UPI001AAFEB48|nr:error-prone DNA polymerase [Shewanella algae]MBO2628644.1 error-prone DNA polymerase [Shewanella algae]
MYAELHAISNYSFLRGASHPDELVQQAAKLGYEAIAITDECSLAGVVKAHEVAKQSGIKLIVGAEFHLPEGCLVLLARNRRGYGLISTLITRGRRRADKGKYRLTLDDFATIDHGCFCLWRPPSVSELLAQADLQRTEHQSLEQQNVDNQNSTNQGLSNQSPSQQTPWLTQLQQRSLAQLNALATRVKAAFSLPLYLLMERQLQPGEAWYFEACEALSNRFSLPCVAAGNVQMHLAERQRLHDVLSCIRHGRAVPMAGELLSGNAEMALKPITAMARRHPQAWLARSCELASRCHFNLDELKYEYPAELVPSGLSASEYLAQEVEKGARRRFGEAVPPEVQTQYRRELKLIAELNYEYFFLTIYDLVCFAARQGILHQGRGSAANSVVCYCLGITEVDPTKVNMLFERFISKERHEPPDIDVDFEHERREEVIQYIYQKYGRERAALAASVITYRFKSAMKDVGKALGLSEQRLDELIGAVDRRDPQVPWQQQLQQGKLLPQQGLGQWLLPLVETLMGFPRHLSQHVGGFVISAGPLAELVPVENAAMAKRTVIQWDKDDLESLGLLKVDVLALGMLTAIRKCFELISRHIRPFAMSDIRWEDPAVYRMLQQGDSMGVFQVESRAQTSMLPRLKPACYYDLVIQIAIVRPGPIQGDMVHPFLRRRDKIEPVTFPSAEVESVLSRTMGVPIFQEQVIQLAMVAAGFSGGEADQLRRAMASWKRSGELEQFEHKLLQGMTARGYSDTFARQIFNQIRGFGEYGFPESHSASFALLAYVSAFLKHYYPVAFCCALLNSQPMGFYSPSQLIQDLRHHGGLVLPVCINLSQWHSTLERQTDGSLALRLGFRLVKGLSEHSAAKIVAGRNEGFTHLSQLAALALPRREQEALASANAFATLGGDRHQIRWQLAARQQSLPLFEQPDEADFRPETALPEVTEVDALLADYACTGLTLGRHPLALLREQGLLGKCHSAASLWQCRHGQNVTVAGLVVGRQRPGTASGVTFITLEDETGNVNLVVWSDTARAQRQAYLSARILKVSGVVEFSSGVLHLLAGRLEDISGSMHALVVNSRDFH